MKQTADRQYTTYLAITGAAPEETGLNITHLRVDVHYWEARKAVVFAVTGVERKANGFETSLLLGDPARRVWLTVERLPRFSKKKLEHWRDQVQASIETETGFAWVNLMDIVAAYGAQVAK